MESLVQPTRQFTSLEIADELPGKLDIPNRPEITSHHADIYRGVWTTPQGEKIDVAVKRFKDPVARSLTSLRNPEARQSTRDTRLRREVYVWSRTEHSNLHPLLGYRSQPEPQLISPWCRHGHLTEYLETHPRLSRLEKLKLIYQAAYGLQHLHSRTPPISHADIKPENVLINDLREAALSDFGLGRVLHGIDIPSGFTTSQGVKGTTAYMAGEPFSGERPNCSSDVYAFGGLILTVMSGKPPFCGLLEPAIMWRAVKGKFPNPNDHPGLPHAHPLWSLMQRCWDKSPTARPSMSQVLWEISLDYPKAMHTNRWLRILTES